MRYTPALESIARSERTFHLYHVVLRIRPATLFPLLVQHLHEILAVVVTESPGRWGQFGCTRGKVKILLRSRADGREGRLGHFDRGPRAHKEIDPLQDSCLSVCYEAVFLARDTSFPLPG